MPALASAKRLSSRMTAAEFIAWPGDGSGTRYELVDGEPRAMAPASVSHGIIQANVARLFGNRLYGTPCHVVTAPGVVPRVRAAFNFRIPDLAVSCVADTAGEHALPDPILVVEILSPSSWPEQPQTVADGTIMLASIDFAGPLSGFYEGTYLGRG